MEYKKEQMNLRLRTTNSIRAFKILDIENGKISILNPYSKRIEKISSKMLQNESEVGNYVDVIFCKTGSHSYSIEVMGFTPPEFTPRNGEDIY